jgi:hypothetical protein
MAQTGYTPISIYYSATASNVPSAGNLVAGELALNTADGKLFYKDSGGVVQTIASKAGPTFSAYQSSAQTLSSGTTTKIQFQTEEWDTNNNFDNATNYRFTPTVAGYYQVNAAINANFLAGEVALYIYKNGNPYKIVNDTQTTALYTVAGTTLVSLNGSTDYIEVYLYTQTGVTINVSSAQRTWFQSCLVRGA